MTTARETYELQQKLDHAEMSLGNMRYEAGDDASAEEAASIAKLAAEVATLTEQVRAAQVEVGGVVGRIPEENLEKLGKKFTAMGKRAAKVSAAAPEFTITEEREVREIKKFGMVVGRYTWAFVVVSGTAPKFAGWSFLATLQHEEGGTIIRRVPGATKEESEAREASFDLVRFRTASPVCDHCKTRRSRKDTYIVLHEETGEVKQIGRTCVGDFLGGQSPEAVLRTLSYLADAEDMLDDDGEERMPAAESGYLTDEYLTHVALMIREHGWVSRSAAGWGKRATADDASDNLGNMIRRVKDKKTGAPAWIDPTEADVATAKAAREFVLANTESSDFMHNVRVAVGSDFLKTRSFGIAAAAVLVYNRSIEKEVKAKVEEQAKADLLNEHFGEVKDRPALDLTVVRVFSGTGASGYGYRITTMQDAEGRTFKTFSDAGGAEVGDKVVGKWTIKEHGEYKGQKETMLFRPAKDLEVIEGAVA